MAVLDTIEREVLNPAVISAAVRSAMDVLRPNEELISAKRRDVQATVSRLEDETERLV